MNGSTPHTRIRPPTIAFAMGDPAGISPELAAKLVASTEIHADAQLVIFGDHRIFEQGARIAQVEPDVEVVSTELEIPLPRRAVRSSLISRTSPPARF